MEQWDQRLAARQQRWECKMRLEEVRPQVKPAKRRNLSPYQIIETKTLPALDELVNAQAMNGMIPMEQAEVLESIQSELKQLTALAQQISNTDLTFLVNKLTVQVQKREWNEAQSAINELFYYLTGGDTSPDAE